jgi:hypothetical protein
MNSSLICPALRKSRKVRVSRLVYLAGVTGQEETKMRTTILSEPFSDIESCRHDVLKFLQSVAWPVELLEVKLWTLAGRPYASRAWKPDQYDLEKTADQISKLIKHNTVVLDAVVTAWEAEIVGFTTDF